MLRRLVLGWCLIVFASSVQASGSWLVRARDARSLEGLAGVFEGHHVQVQDRIPQLNVLVTDDISPGLRAQLFEGGQVLYIEENFPLNLTQSSTDSFYKEFLGLRGHVVVRAPEAWHVTTGSEQVVVAVSDTGIWAKHKELQPNLWKNPGENGLDAAGKDRASNGADDDQNGYVDDFQGWNFSYRNNHVIDDHYHGTHVSGTIAGAGGEQSGFAGISWNSKIMTLKFLNDGGAGTTANAIKAILYAADQGARIMNASWGGDDYSQAMEEALRYSAKKGMLFVAAAGNNGANNDEKPFYPASYPVENVITVAAATGALKKAGFSNYGFQTVDLAAPGTEIYSTFNPMAKTPKQEFYYKLNGTSMAAPHVSGAAALLWARYPQLNFLQVKEALLKSVTPIKDFQKTTISGGLLNIRGALDYAQRWENP